MNSIQQLIQQLCPNGVEWKTLGEVCKVLNAPKKLDKKQYFESGKYPIIDQGQKYIVAYTNDISAIINKDEYVVFGDHTREIKYVDFEFAQGADGLKILKVNKKEICPRFLYHYMKKMQIPSRGYNRHWTIVKEMPIPIPPLEIQNRIVDILDKFSALTAELQAELQARRLQYEYYRENLLSFTDLQEGTQIIWKTLGEVCEILDSKRRPVSKGQRNEGIYPYYGANGIQDYVDSYIFDGTYVLIGEDGSVINKDNSPIINWATGKIWVNNHAHILEEKTNGVKLRFLYYYLQTTDVSDLVWGTPPKLNQKNLRSIPIPLPPLAEQERIVNILDKFEQLTTSLTQGLPAEIKLVQQQYEYYRNLLLTF